MRVAGAVQHCSFVLQPGCAANLVCKAMHAAARVFVSDRQAVTHPAWAARFCPCRERVPRFAWALVLLLLLEGVMLWRYQPWAVPIEVTPPPPGRLA